MRPAAKLAAYGAVLAIVVGGGAGVGAAAGPVDVGADEPHQAHEAHPAAPAATGAADADADADAPAAAAADPQAGLPGGLAVSQGGYRLDAPVTTVAGGAATDFRFRVVDAAGAAVTDVEIEHEKPVHLVVVGRDLVTYAHVHPTLGDDGTWGVRLPALPAGSYRAVADLTPAGGEPLALGVDLTATGTVAPAEVPEPSAHTEVDGYHVDLEGEARTGESELAFTVTRDGEPVRTDPYLGADGHLVAIRAGDLAYLHVHPVEGDGDAVRFAAEFPSPGRYRLFLDVAHGGAVHTAAFTVDVPVPGDGAATDPSPAAGDEHESH